MSFLVKKLGNYRFIVLQILLLTKLFFSSKFQSSMSIFSSQVVDKGRWGFGQWTKSSITHDNICSLVHKKRHPKSCYSDIKYHMSLNITFNVVVGSQPWRGQHSYWILSILHIMSILIIIKCILLFVFLAPWCIGIYLVNVVRIYGDKIYKHF